jgi:hypothetical protein
MGDGQPNQDQLHDDVEMMHMRMCMGPWASLLRQPQAWLSR